MIVEKGNIWDYHTTHWVVIPTNIGYKSTGEAVMGAGLAKQAAVKFPHLVDWYGEVCRFYKEKTRTVAFVPDKLILFPTKPLDSKKPHLSWKNPSNLDLIKKSATELMGLEITAPIVLPEVGCGLGGLDPLTVIPVLEDILTEDRFVLIRI